MPAASALGDIRGLSPRVRGNLDLADSFFDAGGSIPACAGEPPAVGRHPADDAVYPRVCGGTPSAQAAADSIVGLSPRVRGNPDDDDHLLSIERSIPACAGEPPGWPGNWSGTGVYPRVCGGTAGPDELADAPEGLSPRVRGNRRHLHGIVLQERSIPACAGEPWVFGSPAQGDAVYPRVCGGTSIWMTFPDAARGLSPRVRGNPA